MSIINLAFNPLMPITNQFSYRANTTITPRKLRTIHARSNNSQKTTTSNQQQQLNLSVLRFTLGIPGLNESYLPRWIGYGFGVLLVLNHFLGSNSPTEAQLRVEAWGLSLAAFSVAVPYLGKFLKGATPVEQATLPEGVEQIFVMSQNLSDFDKEGLAWATYILLRNTNSISVLISIRGALCVRGYWNTPDDGLKDDLLDWFKGQMEQLALSGVKEALYFPKIDDSEIWKILPKGTRSLLIQPVVHASNSNANEMEIIDGFVMLASSMSYAYSDKDRDWIRAVANKFQRMSDSPMDQQQAQFSDEKD